MWLHRGKANRLTVLDCEGTGQITWSRYVRTFHTAPTWQTPTKIDFLTAYSCWTYIATATSGGHRIAEDHHPTETMLARFGLPCTFHRTRPVCPKETLTQQPTNHYMGSPNQSHNSITTIAICQRMLRSKMLHDM